MGSFRDRLFLVILMLVTVPLALAGLSALELGDRSIEASVRDQHRLLAGSVAAGIDLAISYQVERIEALALDPRIQRLEPGPTGAAIKGHFRDGSFFGSLYVYRASGDLVLGLHEDGRIRDGAREIRSPAGPTPGPDADLHPPAPPPLRVRDRVAAVLPRVVRENRRVTISDLPRREGPRFVLVLVPVRDFVDESVVRGVLSATIVIDGGEVARILGRFPLPGSRYVALLDERGSMVAGHGAGLPGRAGVFRLGAPGERGAPSGRGSPGAPGAPGETGAPGDLWPPTGPGPGADALPGEVVRVGVLEHEGRADLVSISRGGVLGGWIVTGQALDELDAGRRTFRRAFVTILLAALLAAAMASFLLARQTSRPVEALVAAIEDLRAGKLARRLEESGPPELRRAAGAFNELAGDLQKQRLIREIWTRVREE